ncbi:MAG: hypothetical protein JWM90_1616 [Thermoleophilia bacterium]|nr:hypothetical protein [Thermoleophilia bacterium]
MGIELVGTRASGISETASLAERLDVDQGDGISIASAYWDVEACTTAIDLAMRIGSVTQLVLWTAGGTRKAWIAAREAAASPALDLRFIDSPEGGGIFHAKVAGVTHEHGDWLRALVGSANLTSAARERNVELGVLIHDDPVALAQLRDWYGELWTAAVPAARIDFDAAIAIAPDHSEAAARKATFAAAALAAPAPAVPYR